MSEEKTTTVAYSRTEIEQLVLQAIVERPWSWAPLVAHLAEKQPGRKAGRQDVAFALDTLERRGHAQRAVVGDVTVFEATDAGRARA